MSAAFRGVLRRTLSGIVVVQVDPFALPPDPGEAGKQTLEGIDFDGYGVRDDVQRWIALTQPDSSDIRQALSQLARAQQASIVENLSEEASVDNTLRILDGLDCLWHLHPDQGTRISRELDIQILNTDARVRAYVHAASHFGGHTRRLTPKSERWGKCDFTLQQRS